MTFRTFQRVSQGEYFNDSDGVRTGTVRSEGDHPDARVQNREEPSCEALNTGMTGSDKEVV